MSSTPLLSGTVTTYCHAVFVFDYDMNTGKYTLLKQTEVPGGFDRTNYMSERVFATASDGTKVPMSIVYRKGVKLDGTAPLLFYAYGSYGYSVPPTFFLIEST